VWKIIDLLFKKL